MITGLDHSKSHENIAWEIFIPTALALLPMLDGPDGQHRSALVWTVDEKDAAGVLKLSIAPSLPKCTSAWATCSAVTLNSAVRPTRSASSIPQDRRTPACAGR